MKTLISIIGNIKTGKSTIANLLSSEMNLPVFNFESYRAKCVSIYKGKNSTLPQNVWNVLTADIKKQNIAILDSSGVSINEPKIYGYFEHKVIIRLDCARDLSWSRLNNEFQKMQTPAGSKISFSHYDGMMDRRAQALRNIKYDFVFDTKKLSSETIVGEIRTILELIIADNIISESKKVNPNTSKIKSLWQQVFKGGV